MAVAPLNFKETLYIMVFECDRTVVNVVHYTMFEIWDRNTIGIKSWRLDVDTSDNTNTILLLPIVFNHCCRSTTDVSAFHFRICM